MKTFDSEYINHLNKYYPEFDFDSINSNADIAIQMGINRKDAKLFDSEGFISSIQNLNCLIDSNPTFRKKIEKIISIFNYISDEFKDADLDYEKMEKLVKNKNSKLTRLINEFENFISEFFEEYPELFDWLVKPEFVLCNIPEISARSDSQFKCIIGYYRSKYRRTITSASFINASCVCGGGI
jgi:hypothetical protein